MQQLLPREEAVALVYLIKRVVVLGVRVAATLGKMNSNS